MLLVSEPIYLVYSIADYYLLLRPVVAVLATIVSFFYIYIKCKWKKEKKKKLSDAICRPSMNVGSSTTSFLNNLENISQSTYPNLFLIFSNLWHTLFRAIETWYNFNCGDSETYTLTTNAIVLLSESFAGSLVYVMISKNCLIDCGCYYTSDKQNILCNV